MLLMKMEIKYTTKFRNQYRKVNKEIKAAFSETLELFLEDPHHRSLRNHTLKENFAVYNSIDITDDYRALFKETLTADQKIITFHLLGTHEELYEM